MADFAGQIFQFVGGLDPENRSSNITAAVFAAVLSVGVTSSPLAASAGVPEPVVSVVSSDHAGERVEMFGGQLFGKLLVIPGTKALGFVVTSTQFAVEVWNAFRDADQILESIDISGSGGLTIADPYGEPLLIAALDSRIYQATIPSAGATEINQMVLFAFLGDLPGTTIVVTGSRIVLFSVRLDWSEGIEETIEYLTDVLRAYSDAEQRRAIRKLPRRAMSYRALTLNARDAAGLESLIWGWQQQPFGVPWWADSQPLTADLPAGSFSIPVETVDRQFAAGGLVAIWVDEFTFEALTITSVGAHAIEVSSPTQFSWAAGPGTRVIPVFLCRLPPSVEVSRHTSEIDHVDVSFIGESGEPAPAPTSSPAQFKGIDVLEIAPNWETAPLKRSYKRSLITIDPKVGPIQVIDKGGSAIVGQEFPWWLDSHSAVTAFRAFVLRRFGQLVPFWIPTWDQDLILANDCLAGDSGITIRSEFYSRFFFPNAARRFVAFIPVDGSGNVYRKITAAADNGDGTEGLTLESATGKRFNKASTMVSFLTLARLASDRVAIKWSNVEHAEAIIELQELPRELP